MLKILLQFFKRIFKKIWTSNAMIYIHVDSNSASILFNMIEIKSLYLPLVCHFFGCHIFTFNNTKAISFCLYTLLIYCFIIEANQNLLSWIAFLLVAEKNRAQLIRRWMTVVMMKTEELLMKRTLDPLWSVDFFFIYN